MTENEAIKSLEYAKRIIGLSEQGEKWSVNRETIAIDIAIKALEEIQQYREMEQRLQKMYGANDGLLEKMVEHLECHEGVDLPEPVFKARLLTDGEVDKWEAYKAIGTVDECQEARERQMAKNPKLNKNSNVMFCPVCKRKIRRNYDLHCSGCGQAIDWSDT